MELVKSELMQVILALEDRHSKLQGWIENPMRADDVEFHLAQLDCVKSALAKVEDMYAQG